MLCQLRQCEFTVQKSDFASKMIENELKNYETISKTIDAGTEQAKVLIEQNKQKLVLAKKNRKQRMEYDALAKVINQEPDRKGTAKDLEILNKELNELKSNRKRLEGQLQTRRNEFTVLMRSINELQGKLDSSTTNEIESENEQLNDQQDEQPMEQENESDQPENLDASNHVEEMSVECDGELPDSPTGSVDGGNEI